MYNKNLKYAFVQSKARRRKMKKEKNIMTPQLLIDGNIMAWKDSVIQLSNISSVSTVPLEPVSFPSWTLLMLLVGLLALMASKTSAILFIAIAFIAIAAIGILCWYSKNEDLKTQKTLIILMNSGMTFSFLFNNQEFLDKVFGVLSSIIAEGGKAERHVKININNSTISGNASVLNDMFVS